MRWTIRWFSTRTKPRAQALSRGIVGGLKVQGHKGRAPGLFDQPLDQGGLPAGGGHPAGGAHGLQLRFGQERQQTFSGNGLLGQEMAHHGRLGPAIEVHVQMAADFFQGLGA